MKQGPTVPEVGVLAVVPDCFHDPWQSRHQILTRLSAYFHVVWVEPTPHWRHVLAQRAARRAHPYAGGPNGFAVHTTPPWLAQIHRPAWLAEGLDRVRWARCRRALVDRGCRTIVLSLWRPSFAPVLAAVPHDLAAYHVDDEYSFSSVDVGMSEEERRLLESADVVTVHSRGLLRRKGAINANTTFVPNGVDYAAYATRHAEPADLARVPHPRIGYAGYLKPQLDWDVIRALAAEHPAWHFVFVGPERDDGSVSHIVASLSSAPNVHFLGPKNRHELPAYSQHFDVCVMPYHADAYTTCIYPLKLHEYLATGRPVVGSRIETFEEFAQVVDTASTAGDWSAALSSALRPEAQTEDRQAARRAVACRYDWRLITERVARLIAERLGPDVLSRVGGA